MQRNCDVIWHMNTLACVHIRSMKKIGCSIHVAMETIAEMMRTFGAWSVFSSDLCRTRWNVILITTIRRRQQQQNHDQQHSCRNGENARARVKTYHSMFLYTVLRLIVCTFYATFIEHGISLFIFFLFFTITYICVSWVHFLDNFVCICLDVW